MCCRSTSTTKAHLASVCGARLLHEIPPRSLCGINLLPAIWHATLSTAAACTARFLQLGTVTATITATVTAAITVTTAVTVTTAITTAITVATAITTTITATIVLLLIQCLLYCVYLPGITIVIRREYDQLGLSEGQKFDAHLLSEEENGKGM